ncbi:MAG TPA: hypothetical protein VJ574_04335 [Candidatus Bathyarchaeia archaeon]|nr:hypothetical protein [Candidatus Bathyarchaeia archaeon]
MTGGVGFIDSHLIDNIITQDTRVDESTYTLQLPRRMTLKQQQLKKCAN